MTFKIINSNYKHQQHHNNNNNIIVAWPTIQIVQQHMLNIDLETYCNIYSWLSANFKLYYTKCTYNMSLILYILRSMLLELQRPYVLIFPSVGPSSMQASQNILTAFATR